MNLDEIHKKLYAMLIDRKYNLKDEQKQFINILSACCSVYVWLLNFIHITRDYLPLTIESDTELATAKEGGWLVGV